MDVYVLDASLNRTAILDNYESLIWTERYASLGDFELEIKSTALNRAHLVLGTRLFINRSQRVMVVEVVEEHTNESDVEMLSVKGRSVEAILEDRAAVQSMGMYNTAKYYINGIPGDIARTLYHSTCLTTAVNANDVLPLLAQPTFTRDPREPLTVVNWLVEPDSVYNAIKKLCDIHELGFKLIRPIDAPALHFYIYAGKNRTSNQSVLDPLVFSSDLDNIENTKALTSNQLVKNVAYVTSSALNRIIYAPGVSPTVAGFQRRVVVIDLGDVGEPPNAGQYPEQDSEPLYGVPDYPEEPNYGVAQIPLEPDYGAAPDGGMEEYWTWKTNRDAARAQWEQERDQALAQYESNRQAMYHSYTLQRQSAYTQWVNQRDILRNEWINNYNYEVNAWHAENTRLYNVWIAEISTDMTQKASEELDKYKVINSFDGQLNERTNLQYGIDYDLGDLVELRNDDGLQYIRRVTEQIFVSDKEGERAYPTLSETKRTT